MISLTQGSKILFRPLVSGILASGIRTVVLGILLSSVVLAQGSEEEIEETQVAAEAESVSSEFDNNAVNIESNRVIEEIVVTGSRLKRTTFSSISPLQIIDTEGAREIGVIDPAAILQNVTAAAGQQIDLTFSNFVLDNGPGSSTVSLRGLGAGRTLVLLNGRRLASGGVEGAPIAPDLNLIPAALVQRYDLLLDGASSIYGSDAIAGVANVILKKDFQGFDFELNVTSPDQANGDEYNVNATWGKNYDRGFIGVGIEYFDAEAVTFADRKWTAGCDEHREVGLDGRIRSTDLFYSETLGQRAGDSCKVDSLVGRTIVPDSGSVYYTPGSSNGGWNNFTESSLFGIGVDADGDGRADINFRDYDLNGNAQFANLYPDLDRFSGMAYGEYTFEGDMNLTSYFETLYSKREVSINSGAAQFFPIVPADNPFNICNPNGVRGVDCGLAYDELLTNPAFAQQVFDEFGGTPEDFDLLVGASGPAASQIVVSVRGDRNTTEVELEQMRLVIGLRGDLPQLNIGTLSDWSFDTYFSYDKTDGTSSRTGIREDRVDLSLNTTIEDPNNPGSFICGADNDGDGLPDGTDGCVPFDSYAASLYEGLIGDFATQAERDYLFDSRDFETEVNQTILFGYISGSAFELPAGKVLVGFGAEFRKDEIKSIPDEVARDGLFFGFFSDGGATGNKDTREVFGETEFPLLADKFLAKELVVNLSGRYTKDEFYGGASTYSGKVGYRPINSLLLRASYGTSYRAPNLRENFLRSQTGFRNVFDPCFIPDAAIDPISGGYNPDLETRSPQVLANCLANGIDPTTASNNGFNTYSVEVASGGILNLEEETSDSLAVGFSFEQPFFEGFDLTFGLSYYDIDIDSTIVEPGAQFIVNDCFGTASGPSTFCSRITRDGDGFLDEIDGSFLNRDNETARGVDYNLSYKQDVTLFDKPYALSLDINANRKIENSETFVNDDGTSTSQDFVGRFGYAEWTGNAAFRVEYDNYRFTWASRYIDSVEDAPQNMDEFSDIFDTNSTGFTSDTCLGVANGDTDCRDVGYADNYMTHSASLYYYGDTWTLGFGVTNIFDKSPPKLDSDLLGVTVINNTPIGYGYDLDGRSFFFNVQRSVEQF